MLLLVLAYLGGVLTILSPCILPVLPFVFARADRPFARSGLPLLVGMVLTFALVATLAAVGGGWAVQANRYGRVAAIALLALFGLSLLVPELAERATRPLVALGNRLSEKAQAGSGGSVLPSFLLGIATGLLWAPCAGPILGLVLTGAALQGASVHTTLLLLAYAAGAATSLAVALLIGGRVFTAMKRSLGAGAWIRRGLGVAVLGGVAVIALGLDTGLLTRLSVGGTNGVEQALLQHFQPMSEAAAAQAPAAQPGSAAPSPAPSPTPSPTVGNLPVEGTLPSLAGAVQWLNSPPLSAQALRGKVVLVDFWTYSCINCLRSLPYVQAWAKKYRDQGLVVIGVHTPEFAFEKNPDNVKQALHRLGVTYPVAIDNNYAIWRAFGNQYWPAHYFIDAQGRIRYHHFGEGDYAHSEAVLRELLKEAGHTNLGSGYTPPPATGVEQAADMTDIDSPETYVGYERADNFAGSHEEVPDRAYRYTAPQAPALNHWGLGGDWRVGAQDAVLQSGPGRLVYRFHARDLHLVLGPNSDGKPVRFRIRIDGKAPGADHGVDVDADGDGTVTQQRLYQLVRQTDTVRDRTFEIDFLDPGVQVYSFTFG